MRIHGRRPTVFLAIGAVLIAMFAWSFAPRVTTNAAAAAPSGPARAVAMAPTPDGGGYWVASSTGGVYPFGDAHSYGSMSDTALNAPIVGMAATPSGAGYWLVASDGGIFSFGDASFWGSTGGMRLNAPIVGMAAMPSGHGYWLVASDGGIFSFGDASFYGSTGAMHLNAPVVGMAATPSGHGYWLVGTDGGVFSYGDAAFHGSTGAIRLNQPVVGMATTPSGAGYWLVASDGGIFSYGDASFHGSIGGIHLNEPIDGMAPGPGAGGYWLVAADGGIFNFGSAAFDGSATADINPLLVTQLAATGGAQQVLIVDAPSATSTTATLTAYENDGAGWYQVFGAMPAVDGANGWLPGQSRVEGDNTTPEGMYSIGSTMYGTSANPGTKSLYHQLVCGDWWDEDSASPTYNTFQHVACGTTPPYAGESEALWTEGNAYPSMAVINYNTPPTGPLGSGIFLHANIGSPTAGCVSLPLGDLDAVLDWLNPGLHPVIVMGPDAVIRSF
ncbi:MAG TPA: L,D-transpeptidase family protein [Acidimicrobiales bacterium]|nr:L,D-transpeptidase family protein [Acidimicrobiales bacterium]